VASKSRQSGLPEFWHCIAVAAAAGIRNLGTVYPVPLERVAGLKELKFSRATEN